MNKKKSDKKVDFHCKIKQWIKENLAVDATLNNRDMTGQLTYILEERYNQPREEK